MSVKLLTEHHLEFLCLKGGCTGSSKSTHVKMPHCWKSRVTAHICFYSSAKLVNFDNILILFCECHTKLVSVHTENKVRMLYTVVGATMVIILVYFQRPLKNNVRCTNDRCRCYATSSCPLVPRQCHSHLWICQN